MCQTYSLWRSRPEGVSLSAPDARKSQSFPQKQQADRQAEFVRNPADCNPMPQERMRFLTNEPGMSMKTKDRLEMPCAGVALTFRSARRQCKNANLKVGATHFREQSENVYENKGPGWRRHCFLNVCDAPKAQVGQFMTVALTCLSLRDIADPTSRGLRQPELMG
jgi:hypothetical protein